METEIYYIFNADKYVGVLTRTPEGKYSFVQEKFGFLENKLVNTLGLNSSDAIYYNFIEERVFPPNRVNATELLSKLGLLSYDCWEISKKINAIRQGDCYWMSKSKDDGPLFWKKHPSAYWVKDSYIKLKAEGLV